MCRRARRCEIMRIVADEYNHHQQLPPGTNQPRPFCSERAQKARLSITNYTRHPAHTAAHPAISAKGSCKGTDSCLLLRFCITRRLLFGQTVLKKLEQKGQALSGNSFKASFCVRITLRHKIVETNRPKVGNTWDFSFRQGKGGSTTTKRGTFSLLPFLPLAYKTRGHTLPLEITKD